MSVLDPSLGVPLPEKDYGGDCSLKSGMASIVQHLQLHHRPCTNNDKHNSAHYSS